MSAVKTMTWRTGPPLRYGKGGQGFERDGHFFSFDWNIVSQLVYVYEPVHNDWITLKLQRAMPNIKAESIALLTEDHQFTCPI